MSIIRKRIEVIGAKDGKVTRRELNALFDLKEDMVIGADILQTHKLKIDMAKEDIDTSTYEPYHF